MTHQVMEHKVINVSWRDSGWTRLLALELNAASEEGWAPILYSDSGSKATVVLARPRREGK